MKKVLIAAFGLIFVVGCNLPRRYTIDVATIEGCEGFEWNGRVTVSKTHKGFFTGYTVDIIKLEARDGRTMLLDTRGKGVETYVKVEVVGHGQTPGAPEPSTVAGVVEPTAGQGGFYPPHCSAQVVADRTSLCNVSP